MSQGVKGTRSYCCVAGCDRPGGWLDWCKLHYQRWKRHGDALWVRPTMEDRFWSKVDKTETCWLWTACKTRKGYGMFRLGGTDVPAHRFAYELLVGPIPKGLQLDHLCMSKACVRPDHLEPVTAQENTRRALAALGTGHLMKQTLKTHCPQGHPYDESNTYVNAKGHRQCRECWKRWRKPSVKQEAAGAR